MNMPTCVIDFLRTCKIRCICGKWLNRTSHERVSRWVAWPKNCAGLLQQLALPGDFAGDFIYLLSELPIFPPVAFPVLGATLNCGSAGLKIWPIPWWFSEIIAALATSSRWWRCSSGWVLALRSLATDRQNRQSSFNSPGKCLERCAADNCENAKISMSWKWWTPEFVTTLG